MSDTTDRTTHNVEAVEHAMRVCGDEVCVFDVAAAEPQSRMAFSAVGRLLDHATGPLTANSPLVVLCVGGDIDPAWRDNLADNPDSLWERLELLESLWGNQVPHPGAGEPPASPLARLVALQAAADRSFGADHR